jgi:DNA-binding LacI/PurR family transcriptional regulator
MEISEHVRLDRDSAVSLEVQLAQQLRWLIVRGQVRPGEKLPPVRKLAGTLGINMHTARAAYRRLANGGLVESRPGVGTTVSEYDGEQLSHGVADVPSFMIGVIIPAMAAFYRPMLDAIEATLLNEPHMLVVCNTLENKSKVSWYRDQLVVRGVDGIIVVSHDRDEPSGTPAPRADSLPPVVVVDCPAATDPVVLFDAAEGGYQAAKHLIEHGHTRIGIITPPAAPNVDDTTSGIHRALTEIGVDPSPELVVRVPDWSAESGANATMQLVALDGPPSAMLTLSDSLAVGVLEAARTIRLAVPEDLAIVSLGDIDVAQHLDPPLTTVHLAAAEAGATAARMLCRLMADKEPDSTHVILPTRLIARRSCGCLAEPVPT